MTWLLPAGLLALLALPLLVLLRLAGTRRRARRVGSLLLWEQAAEGLPRGTGRALPPLPLLLLEAGAVAAAALGVAHPAWVSEAPALDVLVVVDRTASMAATGTDGTTAWQRGLQRLEARLAEWPETTNYAIRAVPPLPSGALEGPRDAVLAVLRTAEPDPNGSGNAAGAIGGEFHRTLLVTDHLPPLDPADPLEVIAVGGPANNVAITQVRLTTSSWVPATPGGATPEAEAYAVVANFTAEHRSVTLQLLQDGRAVARATAQVAPGRRSGVLLRASDGPLEGAVQVRIAESGDALPSDDSIALDAAAPRPLTVSWIGPEAPPLQRALAAAAGRRVVIAEADGDAPGLTVCHRTVPQPLPSGAVLVVNPDTAVPSLRWVRESNLGPFQPTGTNAAAWSRLDLPARWPPATGYSSGGTTRGGETLVVDSGGRRVVWASTRFGGQPVALCGFPPDGGWELSPGYPIFWARLLETLVNTGTHAVVVERDAAESDLRGAATAHRRGAGGASNAPAMAAAAASGRPWLVLLALVLLAWRLRRRP